MFNGIFCEFRFSLPPSFLFRLPFLSRKQRKQKKVDRRKVVFLRLRRSRQRAAQNGQLACERPFFVPRRMCENVLSTLIILSRYVFCFFSSRKEIVPLLFFLEEKKQKKIICRICFCAFLCILRNPVAQNGRLTYEPAVFSFQAGCAGSRLLSEKPPQPLCLLFLFFKKRNRSLIPPQSCMKKQAARFERPALFRFRLLEDV